MSCQNQGTAAPPFMPYCLRCGKPEHGALVCEAARGPALPTTYVLRDGVYRVLDGCLYRVDPGSPPPIEEVLSSVT
jgi:hypothetical protein